ncbi:MAG: hypothetical protein HQ492_02575 [Woeseiaceae bacterium]|nr:hypothetical protein [Woeseiaceae bacterium]
MSNDQLHEILEKLESVQYAIEMIPNPDRDSSEWKDVSDSLDAVRHEFGQIKELVEFAIRPNA